MHFHVRVTLAGSQLIFLWEVFSPPEFYFCACLENLLKLQFSLLDGINSARAPMVSTPNKLLYFLTLYRILILRKVELN